MPPENRVLHHQLVADYRFPISVTLTFVHMCGLSLIIYEFIHSENLPELVLDL
jgi:hypothetical protein